MATETSFQPGDVVQLKSGGPLVTVAHVGSDGEYFTYYYELNKLIQREDRETVQAAFKKVESPEQGKETVQAEDVA